MLDRASNKWEKAFQAVFHVHDPRFPPSAQLLHVPVWFAKFDSSGKKVVLVIDGHSGKLINSFGLD